MASTSNIMKDPLQLGSFGSKTSETFSLVAVTKIGLTILTQIVIEKMVGATTPQVILNQLLINLSYRSPNLIADLFMAANDNKNDWQWCRASRITIATIINRNLYSARPNCNSTRNDWLKPAN